MVERRVQRAEGRIVMDDLISRLSELRSQYSCFDDNERDAYHTLSDAIEALQEQKTGKWIHDGKDFPHGNDWIHCSVCGKRGINVPADLTNYCPSCGARME